MIFGLNRPIQFPLSNIADLAMSPILALNIRNISGRSEGDFVRKNMLIQFKFLLGIMIIFLGADVWAKTDFRCFASYQGQQIQLNYPSPDETHMASGSIGGMTIEAYDNETSSYQIQIMESEELVGSATLPYFIDATMQIGHRGHRLIVQCQK